MMKFIILKTQGQLFITDNIEEKSYWSSKIPQLIIDGLQLKEAAMSYWFKIDSIPKTVETQAIIDTVAKRYVLKEGYPVTETTPKEFSYYDSAEYENVIGLYTREDEKVVRQVGGLIEFEYEYIESDSVFIGKLKYPYSISIVDQLVSFGRLRLEKPCSITGAELYKIIRNHVKQNINNKYAAITSDYDFCFAVRKRIQYENPKPYVTTEGSGKRAKQVTRYNTHNMIAVLKIAPADYQDYEVQKGMIANNYAELEVIIDEYLDDLMQKINSPVKYCACCNGTGVTLEL